MEVSVDLLPSDRQMSGRRFKTDVSFKEKDESRSPPPVSTSPETSPDSKELPKDVEDCGCRKKNAKNGEDETKAQTANIETLLHEQEEELREKYENLLEKRLEQMKDRYDSILQNEQVRTAYMLREAHRERTEKIDALQSQLHSKNLAALMYVLCTERTENKMEKLRMIEEYTAYIRELQDILSESQDLILHLAKGYKTAAKVDAEWRGKMTTIIAEFLAFIHNYTGGIPETDQFFFDLPALLKTEAPLENPNETLDDVLGDEEEKEEAEPIPDTSDLPWYERLGEECHPFVMYGDMADFLPDMRRKTILAVKAAKTAPKKWQEYAFKDMFIRRSCTNADVIKDISKKLKVSSPKWSCHMVQTEKTGSKQSLTRAYSVDTKGQMSSMLKIISTRFQSTHYEANTKLLAARDSIELTSTTRMVSLAHKLDDDSKEKEEPKQTVLVLQKSKTSQHKPLDLVEEEEEEKENKPDAQRSSLENDESSRRFIGPLGKVHHDSLSIIPARAPAGATEDKINYDRVCPIEKCQRLEMDSFMRLLPPYMRASPFMCFDQNFEDYELCTPEQLEELRQRIEKRKAKEPVSSSNSDMSMEWVVDGTATQTGDSLEDLMPPCDCPTMLESSGNDKFTFDVKDLYPVKQTLDAIKKECLFDDNIEFNRFKVIGETSETHRKPKEELNYSRYTEIRSILKNYPSLLDIFQANAK